jgi:hypothetical protein
VCGPFSRALRLTDARPLPSIRRAIHRRRGSQPEVRSHDPSVSFFRFFFGLFGFFGYFGFLLGFFGFFFGYFGFLLGFFGCFFGRFGVRVEGPSRCGRRWRGRRGRAVTCAAAASGKEGAKRDGQDPAVDVQTPTHETTILSRPTCCQSEG